MSATINHGPGVDHALGEPCKAGDPACIAEGSAVALTDGVEKYGDTVVYPQRLRIEGADGDAKVMLVPAGRAARRKHGGQPVPGPWADLILLPTVLTEVPQAPEPVISLRVGDRVVVDGTTFVVSVSDGIGGKGERGWVRRGYPLLDPEEA